MTITIRAHFEGRVLVPDQPVDIPVNQPLNVEVTACGVNGATNGEVLATAEVIEERRRQLRATADLFDGPVIPLEALRRENVNDDRV
mgnify:CR=1 FL=1